MQRAGAANLHFTVSAAPPQCECCSRPGWNKRDRRCCAPARRNRWPGSLLSTASAARPGLPSPSDANTAFIRRRCCGTGTTPSSSSTTAGRLRSPGAVRFAASGGRIPNKCVFRLPYSLFVAHRPLDRITVGEPCRGARVSSLVADKTEGSGMGRGSLSFGFASALVILGGVSAAAQQAAPPPAPCWSSRPNCGR